MNETRELEGLTAIADVTGESDHSERRRSIANVRMSAGPYLAVASVLTFVSALLLRSEHDGWALTLVVAAWLALPLLALTDRLVFDGKRLRRQGLIPSIVRLLSGRANQLVLSDLEIVETNAVRTLRRGGSVRYRYRTQICGKGKEFVITSGGKNYRKMVRELFPLVHDDKLDNRSRDLRDYLNDPRFVAHKAKLSQLATAAVLDVANREFKLGGKGRSTTGQQILASDSIERAHLLRRLGNELRVAGRLREAGEAFRRALNLTPGAAWLLYDFARLLRSQASAHADAKLLTRARAALRLASIRAERDVVLLPLIGETLLECGDGRKARQVLKKALEFDSHNFKARIRLADLALRDGKLAHVIHHYQEASRVCSELALSRYARREADYYLSLNDDEDYLATELRRINWLHHFSRMRRLSSRITNVAILLALIGGLVDPLTGNIGWSVASSSLALWFISLVGTRFLFHRTKPRSLA
jgi:tetratricopeptide (TPR) repeat protein